MGKATFGDCGRLRWLLCGLGEVKTLRCCAAVGAVTCHPRVLLQRAGKLLQGNPKKQSISLFCDAAEPSRALYGPGKLLHVKLDFARTRFAPDEWGLKAC